MLLDVAADRYLCMGKTANEAFLRLARHEPKAGDADQLRAMFARGLLVKGSPRDRLRSPPRIVSPTCDFLARPLDGSGLIPILQALASQLHITWLLRTKPFQHVIEVLNPPDRRAARKDAERSLRTIVKAARASSFLLRAHNRCLVRALSVQALCHEIGIRPKLVFGVIADPFAAHCWVQLGSEVLIGGFEQARLYTPIFVLE